MEQYNTPNTTEEPKTCCNCEPVHWSAHLVFWLMFAPMFAALCVVGVIGTDEVIQLAGGKEDQAVANMKEWLADFFSWSATRIRSFWT
jgi:hypothetical protein